MPRIAIVSTAHIHTRSYLENLASGADGRCVHAIWDDVTARGQRYAAEFATRFAPDLDALLADPAVNGFIICAENTRHLPLLRKTLPTGKPVFCEKPLTTTVTDAREVLALLQAHPRARLHCGYFQPFTGAMQTAAALLRDNALGRVTRCRFRNAHHAAYGRWFDKPDLQWFHEPDRAGGGAFMDLGTHAIHLLRTLFGPVTEVWASIRNESGIYPAVDDFGVAHLRFASGVLGTVEAAWTQTGGVTGLEVVGSEKTLWHNGTQYVVAPPRQPPTPLTPLPEQPRGVDRLVATILGQISADQLQTDLAAALDAVAIMEAAYQSSRTGHWTTVPPLA
jgi:predicted dehydrogenase